ncbi:hypothetical protein BU26DRAFT_287455 [Trematosphaeria pertusa]|uniref:Uncharacterized protein n=1 Tax=Trematosphaeria pertusa TaxID=390896 RepID=A0A6A6IJF8_9PLEO|nr:uncharacterized protein BU26DRAFT_287455 [Trematosphaeria pertusa]KAF2249683.1 hypothetical protein BU26DRAFT_287455 [Trematosphaeria pertusa]
MTHRGLLSELWMWCLPVTGPSKSHGNECGCWSGIRVKLERSDGEAAEDELGLSQSRVNCGAAETHASHDSQSTPAGCSWVFGRCAKIPPWDMENGVEGYGKVASEGALPFRRLIEAHANSCVQRLDDAYRLQLKEHVALFLAPCRTAGTALDGYPLGARRHQSDCARRRSAVIEGEAEGELDRPCIACLTWGCEIRTSHDSGNSPEHKAPLGRTIGL